MKVVIAGVGTEKGFLTACKALEHRQTVYGLDSAELKELRYIDLVRQAPGCYFARVDLENEMQILWKLGPLNPDVVLDCTKYPKEQATLEKVCKQKHWEYHR